MRGPVDRTIFVTSQLMRVRIREDRASQTWILEGTPAEAAQPDDEIVLTQLELLEIYHQYSFWGEIGMIEKVMGWIERRIGRFINLRRQRRPWKHVFASKKI